MARWHKNTFAVRVIEEGNSKDVTQKSGNHYCMNLNIIVSKDMHAVANISSSFPNLSKSWGLVSFFLVSNGLGENKTVLAHCCSVK